jgi:uncharacterized protein YecT (DUF1311 family)
MKMLVVFLMLALAAPAAGQDADAAAERLRGCLGAAENRAGEMACMGIYAQDCSASVEGGETTAGMSRCAAAEAEGWDRMLNETWADLVVLVRRRAILDEEAGAEPVDLEGLLVDAQRAWIAFRDADCKQEVAVWGEGSMRTIAGAWCGLERTAQRVFELRAKRATMQVD